MILTINAQEANPDKLMLGNRRNELITLDNTEMFPTLFQKKRNRPKRQMHYSYIKVELDVFPETEVDSIYNHKQIVFRYIKNNSHLIIPG